MSDDDLYDQIPNPGAETILRESRARETLPLSQEQPLQPPPWQVGQRVGDFVIEAMLGSGVTSTVYRARQITSGKTFALKVLRVRSENTLAASRLGYRRVMPLSHPSLVRIHGMYQLDGMIAFSMEEVTGEPISKVIDAIGNDRQQVFRLAARLAHDVGGALQMLHAAGLVHRDVKPDNLLVEPSGSIRLIDYGLVGCFDPDSDPDARRSYLAGTYWYMAPESISSQIYPPACDVYALGCVLLELIANPARLPDPQDGVSLVEAVGELDRVIPSDVPDELRDLLHDMLDPKTENRPLASQLVRYGRSQLMHSSDWSLLFRPTDLLGREQEMQLAQKWFQDVARTGTGWLHISGESGTGKTWFAGELRRRLSANRWFQIFGSTCVRREDVSLQIFEEMADAIARRYIRDDRDPLQLSATSAAILSRTFPALRPILRSAAGDGEISRPEEQLSELALGEGVRSFALRAGVEFIDRLCQYGPVLLIIDEFQWADDDSIHVLDSLLDEVTGSCGIITISSESRPRLRHVPQQVIRLDPLDQDQSFRLLRNVLGSQPLGTDRRAIENLAKMGQGNALRLTQLAASLSADDGSDWHERLRDGELNGAELWRSKLQLLDQSAKQCLAFLATAGGPVSTQLLGQVAELTHDADMVAWELIRHHLARESAADPAEIEVAHSRIADRVANELDPAEKAELHLRWANHLKKESEWMQRSNVSYAARIAWHLLEAGRPSDAAPYAQQAAEEALRRFAYSEAAKWFTRVAELVDPGDATEHLHRALECYEAAGHPGQAAEILEKLLAGPGLDRASHAASELQRRLAENLFRCGQLAEARSAVGQLAQRLGLPRQKPQWLSPLSLALNRWRLRWTRRPEMWDQRGQMGLQKSSQQRPVQDGLAERYVEVCVSLARPISLYDNHYAMELILAGMRSLDRSADPLLRIAAHSAYAVIGSYNPGPQRDEADRILQEVTAKAQLWGAAASLAEIHSAWGHRHLMLGQWSQCAAQSQMAIDDYANLGERSSFEINHMRFPLLWALYSLGRLSDLRSLTQQMSRQADERRDRFMHQVTHCGLAGASYLVVDDPDAMRKRHLEAANFLRGTGATMAQLITGLAPVLRWIYLDRPASALRYLRVLVTSRRASTLRRVQILRVLYAHCEALASIRLARRQSERASHWHDRAEAVCRRLRREATPYAELLATFYEAQICDHRGHQQRSRGLYQRAAAMAEEQQILPLQFAATDRLQELNGSGQEGLLHRHLVDQGVQNPQCFERLYRADTPR